MEESSAGRQHAQTHKDKLQAQSSIPSYLQTGLAQHPAIQRKTLGSADTLPFMLRSKLSIGNLDDEYEQEAEKIAEIVLAKNPAWPVGSQPTISIGSQTNGAKLQSLLEVVATDPIGGEPLAPDIRQRIEPIIGSDLSSTRVHSDQKSQQAAAGIQAQAFTYQNNIFLGPGQSGRDLGLMAHEATHVVQQESSIRRRMLDQNTASEQSEVVIPTAETSMMPTFLGGAIATSLASPTPVESVEPTEEAVPETIEAKTDEETQTEQGAEEKASAQSLILPTVESESAEDSPEVAADIAATQQAETTRMEAVIERVDNAAAEQQGPANNRSSQQRASRGGASAASAAVRSPAREANALGQAAQVETMNEQEAGEVDQQSFLTLVRAQLAELELPANPAEMEEFSENEGASSLHEGVMGGVTQQTGGAQASIRGATEAEAQPAEERVPTPLRQEQTMQVPTLNVEETLPLSRNDIRVSQPQTDNQTAIADRLEQEKQAEEYLDRPQDPQYAQVLDTQDELVADAEVGPPAYRVAEQEQLAGETGAVAGLEREAASGMEQAAERSVASRSADQATAMSQEEQKRQEITTHIESIYTATQADVQTKLDALNEDVDGLFTRGEARAKERFENYVDEEMSDWKWERYGEAALVPVVGVLLAAGTWAYDQWEGIENFPEIIAIFETGRQQYLNELETVIVDIGNRVDASLEWCQTRIEQGRNEITTYVDSLEPEQQRIGEEAAGNISSRFDDLSQTVNGQRQELANRLAQRYQESVTALDAQIEEMQAENSGLREDFEALLDDVLDVLQNLGELLPRIARHIPGYTLFTVIIEFNPLTGAAVEQNGHTLLEGLMGLVPFGTFIFDALNERGVIDEAFGWVEGELGRLDLTQARIEDTIDAAWEDIRIAEGIDYNLEVLIRHFGQLMIDVTNFALSLVDYLIDLIKRTALDIVDEFLEENKAWALLKKVLRHDPLHDVPVEATTAEIIEDFLMLIGKEEELEQMREQGTVQETADWLDTHAATFSGLMGELVTLFTGAWELIQPENLPNFYANLENLAVQAEHFFSGLFDFAVTIALKVFELIKNALLAWLKANATNFPGYHLLTVILGKDVFTQEDVPRTPINLIRGFMSLVPGGEAQFQELSESGVVPQAAARIESLLSELGISWSFVQDLFLGIWDSLSIDDFADPIGAFMRIIDRFGEPIGRLLTFVTEVFKIVIELILRMMGFPFELVDSIVSNAMQAITDIVNDPVGFLFNILAAMKLGFSNFFGNILQHLLGGLTDWLFRGLRDAGVEPPSDFSVSSILGFVLDVLGLSMDRVWEKLAERIGQENVDRIRGAVDRLVGIWNFISDVQERGMVAIWEYIESKISGLWNMVLSKASEWIMTRIIARAVTWLLSLLDPTGIMPIINSCIAFFRAVQSAIEYLRDMLELINDYVSTIASVARGDVTPGAAKMEQGLANAIPMAIGFLANQFGLGNIGEKISEIIGGVREMVDKALDWLLDQAMRLWEGMQRMLGIGNSEETQSASGDPNGSIIDDGVPLEAPDGQHRVFVDFSGSQPNVMMASTPITITNLLADFERRIQTLPASQQERGAELVGLAQQAHRTMMEKAISTNRRDLTAEDILSYDSSQDTDWVRKETRVSDRIKQLFELFHGVRRPNVPGGLGNSTVQAWLEITVRNFDGVVQQGSTDIDNSARHTGQVLNMRAGANSAEQRLPVITRNTGDTLGATNGDHAEHHLVAWANSQDSTFKNSVVRIHLRLRQLSPCRLCSGELIALYRMFPNLEIATLSWGQPYISRAHGDRPLETRPEDLQSLINTGWAVSPGPGRISQALREQLFEANQRLLQ